MLRSMTYHNMGIKSDIYILEFHFLFHWLDSIHIYFQMISSMHRRLYGYWFLQHRSKFFSASWWAGFEYILVISFVSVWPQNWLESFLESQEWSPCVQVRIQIDSCFYRYRWNNNRHHLIHLDYCLHIVRCLWLLTPWYCEGLPKFRNQSGWEFFLYTSETAPCIFSDGHLPVIPTVTKSI